MERVSDGLLFDRVNGQGRSAPLRPRGYFLPPENIRKERTRAGRPYVSRRRLLRTYSPTARRFAALRCVLRCVAAAPPSDNRPLRCTKSAPRRVVEREDIHPQGQRCRAAAVVVDACINNRLASQSSAADCWAAPWERFQREGLPQPSLWRVLSLSFAEKKGPSESSPLKTLLGC